MGSELDTITIYEIDGSKYTGAQRIEIKSHRRFLSFVTLRVGNHEYSIGSDDLTRAIGRVTTSLPPPEEGTLLEGPAEMIKRFAEEQVSGRCEKNRDSHS